MESNNANLDPNMEQEDPMLEIEHTTADVQEQAELPVETQTPVDEFAVDAASEIAADLDDEADDEAAAPIMNEENEEAVSTAVDLDDDDEDDEAAPIMDEEDVIAAVDLDEEDEDDEDDEDDSAPDDDQPAPRVKKNDIVTGTVIETSPTEVLVDLGEDLVGVIASRELERMDRAALEALQAGSPVTAFVLKVRGANGQPVLSLARAEEESNWRLAEEHYESKSVYFSKVAGYNKGGLIVRFGKVRGFVPASQISRERQQRATGGSPEERWGSMVGDDVAVKVVEIDRARNRLILSERAAACEREDDKHVFDDGDAENGANGKKHVCWTN